MTGPDMSGPVTRVPFEDEGYPVANGAGMTHRGQVREANEDAILTDPDGILWAVADGMGGYGNGELASDIVVDSLSQLSGQINPAEALRASLRGANAAVHQRAAERAIERMGATCVAMLILEARAYVAWVGDSRAYLWREGKLSRLTRDHSVVQELIDRGDLDPEAAEKHPERHIVTRAIGVADMVDVDSLDITLAEGDRLLLCSDGLTCCVSDGVVESHLGADQDPERLCHALLTEAMLQGAPDNVSVIVVKMEQA